jgi:hypothetical protein
MAVFSNFQPFSGCFAPIELSSVTKFGPFVLILMAIHDSQQ